MKRAILVGFLALSILGSIGSVTAFNLITKNGSKVEIEDVIGSKSELKEVKIEEGFNITRFTKKTLLITRDGIKDEKFENAYEREYLKDKKLYRGINGNRLAEDNNDSVIVDDASKKGIFIRWKKDKVYKEFYLKGEFKKLDGGSRFTFLKDDIAYAIFRENSKKYQLLKIDLKAEKLLETIDITDDGELYINSREFRKECYVFKDNKLYIPAFGRDKEKNRCVKMLCYNLLDNTIDSKNMDIIAGDSDNFSEFMINEKLYVTKLNSKRDELTVSIYGITSGEEKNMKFDTSILKGEYARIFDIKETEDNFYVCGDYMKYVNDNDSFIMALDKKNDKVTYFGKLSDKQKFYPDLIIK